MFWKNVLLTCDGTPEIGVYCELSAMPMGLPRFDLSVESIPISLKPIELPFAPSPLIETPAWLLKPMVLATAAVVPPIVASPPPLSPSIKMPTWLPRDVSAA